MKIGTNHSGYNETRNIFFPWSKINISVMKQHNFMKVLDRIWYKLLSTTNHLFHNTVLGSFGNKVDGFHFYNGISLMGNTPWLVTFESVLPRIGKVKMLERCCVKRLAHSSCKAIIAMSKCNFDNQQLFLKSQYPEYAEQILKKLKHLYPLQELNVSPNFKNRDKLRFLFVGTDFYRKGGHTSLRAFVNAFEGFKDVEFIIVSTLKSGYVSDYTEENDKWVKTQIKKNKHIIWLNGCSNDKVIKLMNDVDVILLPTFADTFGYSVLEGMANACVPVVSNVRALPELVTEESGYIVETKITEQKNLDRTCDIQELSKAMANDLFQVFSLVYKEWNSEVLSNRKMKAYNWIKENCNSEIKGNQLKKWLFE